MNFEQFASLHGLLIGSLVEGRWVRVPTEDHPRSRNGAYKYLGDVGWVQNWATMTEPAMWKSDEAAKPGARREAVNRAVSEESKLAKKAAQKAAHILSECELYTHPYLEKKGFPEEKANIWNRETDNLLVIPMKSHGDIVGVQLINPDGGKKFLFGQHSGGAEFIFNAKGRHFLCEGYATALSVRQALTNVKIPYTLHVCFSAGNMKRMALGLQNGYVIADNDESGTGERVAKEIGWPYWMSDTVGEDANDYARRKGVFSLAMGLKRLVMQ